MAVLWIQISWNGYLLQFYNNSELLLDHQLMTPIYISLFFCALFAQALLKTRKRVPWQHHVFTTIAVLSLTGAIATWFISSHLNSILASSLAVLNIVFVFAAALHANMEEHAMARHFLAMRAMTTGVVLIAIFNVNGYLPQGAFTAWGVALAITFEATVMAISMAWCCLADLRHSYYKQANEFAQEEPRQSLVNLADVCHELRTPISGVLGMADLLLSSTITDQQRNQIKTINKSGQALLDVTNKLADLSSIERGNVELNSAPFELTPLIESCIENCRGRAEFNNIELIYHLDGNVAGFVKGDQEKLQQTIINLLQFALRHVEQGEVVLSVIAGDSKQTVFSIRSGHNTLVERNMLPSNREFGNGEQRRWEGAGPAASGVRMSRRCASMARTPSHLCFALRDVEWEPDRAATAPRASRHLDDDGVRAPRPELPRAGLGEADVCPVQRRCDSDRDTENSAR